MKSVFARSRYTIFAASLLVAFLYSLYRVGPPPIDGYEQATQGAGLRDSVIRDNLGKYLKARYQFRIGPAGVVLAPRFGVPEGYGFSVIAWFTGSEPESTEVDLYSVNAFMSQRGIPLSVDRPINVSNTPDSDEFILDAEESRVLFQARQSDDRVVVTMLGFNDASSLTSSVYQDSWLHKVDAMQRFGQWRLPWRVELRSKRGVESVSARLFDERIEGQIDGVSFVYEIRTGRFESEHPFELIQGGVGEGDAWHTWNDVLRASSVFGEGRLNTFLDMFDALTRRMELMLGDEDETILLPPHLPQSLSRREHNWPPRIPHSDSSDLKWDNASVCRQGDCPVMQLNAPSLARLGNVNIVAFDSRRLGLQYSAGRKYPASSTGLVGGGRLPLKVADQSILAIPATTRHGSSLLGAISMDRVLVPPAFGRPTMLMDSYGQVGFGIWSDDKMGADWSSLWQGHEPMIEGGLVVQSTLQRAGGALGRHGESRVFRSGIGMSVEGHILYAYGRSISTEVLAKAMVQAGAVFAVPLLDHQPHGALLNRAKVWRDGVEHDESATADTISEALEYFWVYRSKRLPSTVESRGEGWAADAGKFAPFYGSGCYELVSRLTLTGEELKSASSVTVYAVDTLQLRAHLLPGVAENRPVDSERLRSLRLPSDPLFSINVGLRNLRSPYGMIFERRVWRQPKTGVLSLVADGRGTIRFGTYGGEEVPDSVRWYTLIQGPSMLRGGHVVGQGHEAISNTPVVAVSMKDRVAYFLVSEDGNRDALIKSARHLGLDELMSLGERGSTDTGLVDRYYSNSGKLMLLKADEEQAEPFRPSRGFDTSILFTGRVAPPQTRMFSGRVTP
jgi:hypothetical protein